MSASDLTPPRLQLLGGLVGYCFIPQHLLLPRFLGLTLTELFQGFTRPTTKDFPRIFNMAFLLAAFLALNRPPLPGAHAAYP
jgi:hypothetical protein